MFSRAVGPALLKAATKMTNARVAMIDRRDIEKYVSMVLFGADRKGGKPTVQGAWYDPSDFYNYLGAKGPELVPQPLNFVSGWSAQYGATLVGSDGFSVSTTTGAGLSRAAFDVGKTYEIVVSFTKTAGIELRLANSTSSAATFAVSEAGSALSGVLRGVITAANASLFIRASAAAGTVTVNSVSVRELPNFSRATMFQDAAGTIPVTGVEQPVGLIMDKSGNGNHASQATAPARPYLSARVNLLMNTDLGAFGGGVGMTSSLGSDVGGVFTRCLANTGASTTHYFNAGGFAFVVGVRYTVSAEVKPEGLRYLVLHNFGNRKGVALFDLELGTVGITTAPADAAPWATIAALPDGWFRVALTFTQPAGADASIYWTPTPLANGGIGYPATEGQGVLIRRTQTEVAPAFTSYQRVASATDYDWQGWPLYLRFDGVDDRLSAASKNAFNFMHQRGCYYGMSASGLIDKNVRIGTGHGGNAGVTGVVGFGVASTLYTSRAGADGTYYCNSTNITNNSDQVTAIMGYGQRELNPVRLMRIGETCHIISSEVAGWPDLSSADSGSPFSIPVVGNPAAMPFQFYGLVILEASDTTLASIDTKHHRLILNVLNKRAGVQA